MGAPPGLPDARPDAPRPAPPPPDRPGTSPALAVAETRGPRPTPSRRTRGVRGAAPADPPPRDGGAWPALEVPVEALPGVGPARRRQLAALGIHTVADLLRHLPRHHEDRTRVARVVEVTPPGFWSVAVTVLDAREFRARGGTPVLQARVTDGTGLLAAVWFGQPYLARVVVPGARLLLHGAAAADRFGRPQLRSPEVEPLDRLEGAAAAAPGLVPVYPLGAGMTQRALRAIARRAVEAWAPRLPETLPADLRARLQLVDAPTAWRHAHFPPSAADLEAARRRIVFEELLQLQLGLLLRRRARAGAVRAFRHAPPGELSRTFRARLPFRLTAAQERVLAEIERDLEGPRPMYRLVQGDVGSGKTVVAAAAMLRAVEGGRQAALLAPTEILAEQHYLSLRRLYAGLCRVGLLTGSTAAAERRRLREALAAGQVDVLAGTHALLQADVAFRSLAMAVTDEQHRFGVRQRDLLAAKGARPDILVMTATPIPRTLAMTLYGDLEVSLIDELPPGRGRVRTFCRPPARRPAVYAFVRAQVAAGRQAFVVCPLIAPGAEAEGANGGDGAFAASPLAEPGDAEGPRGAGDPGAPEEAECAEPWAAALAAGPLAGTRLGLLHGRMPLRARERTMAAFVAGEIQVLVATTVVEVGVDVPNASVMVVEGAHRFGLAQLHQLRGRVGRGPHPAYCILIARGGSERLDILTRTQDGFAIAEADLRQRGPGELLGTRQHGLPELELADPLRDLPLLQEARRTAEDILQRDPELAAGEHRSLARAVAALFAAPRG